ncbi:MAG: hypothetical protein AAGI30_00645 [Planctomycetota bacterium]
MTARAHLVVCATLVSLLAVLCDRAWAQDDGVSIRFDPPPEATTVDGYAVYGLTIANTSDRDRTVRVEIRENGWEGLVLGSLTRTVDVPAGTVVRTRIAQPPADIGQGMVVWVDGRRRPNTVFFPAVDHREGPEYYWGSQTSRQSQPMAVLASTSLPNAAERSLDQAASEMAMQIAGGSPSTGISLPEAFAVVNDGPVGQWSTDPLAYTRYRAVVISASDTSSMPSDVHSALEMWIRDGGQLAVVGDPLSAQRAFPLAHPVIERRDDGDPTLRLGFGSLTVFESDEHDSSRLRAGFVDMFDDLSHELGTPALTSSTDAEWDMSVGPDDDLPVRGLLSVLIVFALLIGPVNVITLARLRRRTLLFVTVPVLGVVFSLAIFGFGFVQGGIRPIARTASLTVLDQASAFASTRAHRGYFAPLTPGDGLRFDADTRVRLLMEDESHGYSWNPSERTVTLDLTDGQHLRSGWIRPRVPEHFLVSKAGTRRERVTFDREADGSVQVLNGLGVGIQRIVHADERGVVFGATDIAPGSSVALERLDPESEATRAVEVVSVAGALSRASSRGEAGAASTARRIAGVSGSARTQGISWVPRGGYVAVLDEDPFLEPGLENLRSHEQLAVVVGLLGEEE